MKKIIIFIILAFITFSWFVTHYTTEPEKVPPANTPFISKSNVSVTCPRIRYNLQLVMSVGFSSYFLFRQSVANSAGV